MMKLLSVLSLIFSFQFASVTHLQAIEFVDLKLFEKRVYCQNGEDGIIQKLLKDVGVDSEYYVEFGATDGHYLSNTKLLREKHGWNGLLLDAGYENKQLNLRKEFITAENINELFEKYNVPYNLDLLSIDLDYNDFYIWKAIDNKYQPKIVIIEYNCNHLPTEDKVVIYDPNHTWDLTNYYSASILAMLELGKSKGYTLVYADEIGINLFFVRSDLVHKEYKNMNDVIKLYPYLNEGRRPMHLHDNKNRPYTSSSILLE